MANSYSSRHVIIDSGEQYDAPRNLPKRPQGLNPTGQTIKVRLNHFPVETLPSKPIYQYDVRISEPIIRLTTFSADIVPRSP